jgi:hypothetical protein
MASRYGKKSQDKVHTAMHEMEQGTLRSGSGKKVTSRKQAVAIGLDEARKEGGKGAQGEPLIVCPQLRLRAFLACPGAAEPDAPGTRAWRLSQGRILEWKKACK